MRRYDAGLPTHERGSLIVSTTRAPGLLHRVVQARYAPWHVLVLLVLLEGLTYGSYVLGLTVVNGDTNAHYLSDSYYWWNHGGILDPPDWVPYTWMGRPAGSNLQDGSYVLAQGLGNLVSPWSPTVSAITSAVLTAFGALGMYLFVRRLWAQPLRRAAGSRRAVLRTQHLLQRAVPGLPSRDGLPAVVPPDPVPSVVLGAPVGPAAGRPAAVADLRRLLPGLAHRRSRVRAGLGGGLAVRPLSRQRVGLARGGGRRRRRGALRGQARPGPARRHRRTQRGRAARAAQRAQPRLDLLSLRQPRHDLGHRASAVLRRGSRAGPDGPGALEVRTHAPGRRPGRSARWP